MCTKLISKQENPHRNGKSLWQDHMSGRQCICLPNTYIKWMCFNTLQGLWAFVCAVTGMKRIPDSSIVSLDEVLNVKKVLFFIRDYCSCLWVRLCLSRKAETEKHSVCVLEECKCETEPTTELWNREAPREKSNLMLAKRPGSFPCFSNWFWLTLFVPLIVHCKYFHVEYVVF